MQKKKTYFSVGLSLAAVTILVVKKTKIDVYETLCPQQMLVHKGGKIKSWGGKCRDVTPTKSLSWGGKCRDVTPTKSLS